MAYREEVLMNWLKSSQLLEICDSESRHFDAAQLRKPLRSMKDNFDGVVNSVPRNLARLSWAMSAILQTKTRLL